jgi:hypothetical protein
MSLSRIFTICLLVLCSGSAYATDSSTPLSENVIARFFATIAGTWDGRAIETPVGPVDYAINFHLCDKGVIAGVAELRVSNHHWRFWRSDGELRLTFLSTFRGNQEPTQLVVSKIEENTIWFHAPELALLTLSVTLTEPNMHIRIFHHNEPHVYIHLMRADKQITDVERAEMEEESCKIL